MGTYCVLSLFVIIGVIGLSGGADNPNIVFILADDMVSRNSIILTLINPCFI